MKSKIESVIVRYEEVKVEIRLERADLDLIKAKMPAWDKKTGKGKFFTIMLESRLSKIVMIFSMLEEPIVFIFDETAMKRHRLKTAEDALRFIAFAFNDCLTELRRL